MNPCKDRYGYTRDGWLWSVGSFLYTVGVVIAVNAALIGGIIAIGLALKYGG